MGLAVPTDVLRPNFAHVAQPAAAPLLGVGVEQLQPATTSRQPDAVAELGDRRKVRNAGDHIARRHGGPCGRPIERVSRAAEAVEGKDVAV